VADAEGPRLRGLVEKRSDARLVHGGKGSEDGEAAGRRAGE
jgi:hypothetical protein